MYVTTSLARLLIAAAVLSLAACGADVGPSADKVRLDLQDRVDRVHNSLLESALFRIDDRTMPAEDRVRFHITFSYTVNKKRAQRLEKNGYSTWKINRAKRLAGLTKQATVFYRLKPGRVWKLTRILPGYQ